MVPAARHAPTQTTAHTPTRRQTAATHTGTHTPTQIAAHSAMETATQTVTRGFSSQPNATTRSVTADSRQETGESRGERCWPARLSLCHASVSHIL